MVVLYQYLCLLFFCSSPSKQFHIIYDFSSFLFLPFSFPSPILSVPDLVITLHCFITPTWSKTDPIRSTCRSQYSSIIRVLSSINIQYIIIPVSDVTLYPYLQIQVPYLSTRCGLWKLSPIPVDCPSLDQPDCLEQGGD